MIKLIKGFKYDNKYDYVKLFSSKSEQNSYFNSYSQIIINDENYLQENKSFNVEIEYDELVEQGVNYIIFNNGYRDIFAFITSKEYLNDEVTRIVYEVDVFNTYLFDFTIDKSFVERKNCSLGEITDYDEGIEIGEHIVESDTILLNKEYTYFAMFTGFKDYYINENVLTEIPFYDESRPTTKIDGITYPLLFIALEDGYINDLFNKYMIDLPNLVGIIRMPNCTYNKVNLAIPIVKTVDGKLVKNHLGCQYVVSSINSINDSGNSISIPKSDITDFYPYTYYTLTDGETSALTMQPQYLSSSLSIQGRYALSHTPVERYYPSYYKGSTNGTIYNITNTSVMMLPTGTNGGIETITNSMNSFEQSKKSLYSNILMGAVVTGVGIATGGVGLAVAGATGASTIVSSFNTIKENIARNKDLELTPSSISSYGTPSTRAKFGTNSVRVVKYTIKEEYKNRVREFTKRYGNKYNNFDTINLKTYKGYIKFANPNIDSKIDNIFINKIIDILERGVYIE